MRQQGGTFGVTPSSGSGRGAGGTRGFRLCAALASVMVIAPAPRAAEMACGDLPVTVQAADEALAERTCATVDRVMPRLASCGVTLSRPQTIEVVDSIASSLACLGVYHLGEDRLEVLAPCSVERLRSADSAFKAIPNEVYFDSVVAHELAHAAYDGVTCPYADCVVTSEYIAYAMQVYTMPPEARRAFEAGVDMDEKVGRDDITSIGLMFAPDMFARNVWAHFSQREDGCAYVGSLMRGDIVLDRERP